MTSVQLVSMVLCVDISTPSPSVRRRTISTLNTIGILLGVTLRPLLGLFGCRPCHQCLLEASPRCDTHQSSTVDPFKLN